jgi:hypothetical protein
MPSCIITVFWKKCSSNKAIVYWLDDQGWVQNNINWNLFLHNNKATASCEAVVSYGRICERNENALDALSFKEYFDLDTKILTWRFINFTFICSY